MIEQRAFTRCLFFYRGWRNKSAATRLVHMENVKENDMANVLQLRIGGKGYEASPVKVDRDKLYGFTEVRATDMAGGPCRSASLDPETSEIIPEGGVKIGMVDADVNPNDGLLLASNGKAFLFVGEKTAFEYVGIETEAVAESEEGGT